jgi:hypothetical protein
MTLYFSHKFIVKQLNYFYIIIIIIIHFYGGPSENDPRNFTNTQHDF